MPHFLFISATNGNNLELAHELSSVAETEGATTELIQLDGLELPLFSPTHKEQLPPPEAAQMLTNKLVAADALVLLAPEYNGSTPPLVTNAIAWMSVTSEDFRAAFNGKFAVIGTHSGGNGFKVLEAMRSQLNHLGMIVLARSFNTSHQPQNPDSAKAIFKQLIRLATH